MNLPQEIQFSVKEPPQIVQVDEQGRRWVARVGGDGLLHVLILKDEGRQYVHIITNDNVEEVQTNSPGFASELGLGIDSSFFL